jgi:hypothetical protein
MQFQRLAAYKPLIENGFPVTFNQRVVGSIPTALTKKIKCLAEKRRRRGDFGEAWGKPYSSPCLRLSRRETPSL